MIFRREYPCGFVSANVLKDNVLANSMDCMYGLGVCVVLREGLDAVVSIQQCQSIGKALVLANPPCETESQPKSPVTFWLDEGKIDSLQQSNK